MTRRLVALIIALLCVASASCSVPRDEKARIVENPKPDTSVPITRPDGPRAPAKLYFVRSTDNLLEAVTANVRMQSPGVPPGPYELLEALIIDGPPPDRRLESKIPNNVRFQWVQGPASSGDEVIVLLTNFDPKGLNREALILMFQQIVFTLTELPQVNSVQFSVNSALYPVPLRTGGDKKIGQGVKRLPDYEPQSVYTTTTLPPTTTAPPPTTPPPATPTASSAPGTAPGASAPPGTSR